VRFPPKNLKVHSKPSQAKKRGHSIMYQIFKDKSNFLQKKKRETESLNRFPAKLFTGQAVVHLEQQADCWRQAVVLSSPYHREPLDDQL